MSSHVRGVRYNALALKHARTGDLATAVRIWQHASARCDTSSQILFNLALCYQNGLGIAKDVAKVVCLMTIPTKIG